MVRDSVHTISDVCVSKLDVFFSRPLQRLKINIELPSYTAEYLNMWLTVQPENVSCAASKSQQQQNVPVYLRAQEMIQQGITYYNGSNAKAVEVNQVYVIDYTKTDNSKMRLYYISEGKMQNRQLITENIATE